MDREILRVMARKCNVCGAEVKEVTSLGDIYISNFIPADHKSEDYPKSNLTLDGCKICNSVQLRETVNPDVMYSKYWYYSGVNQTMRNALKNVIDNTLEYTPRDGGIWLDIASNDGTLLGQVPKEYTTIGIDPADEDIMKVARQNADHIVNDYFSKEAYESVTKEKADVVTCIAMFYDLDDPLAFLGDVKSIIKDDGVFVLQMSYTPLMLRQLEFGNICAEHVMYYTFNSIRALLHTKDFEVIDVTFNDINGGSFRVYATPNSDHILQQKLDVGEIRMDAVAEFEYKYYESEFRMNWHKFEQRIEALRAETRCFIMDAVEKGKTVYGYGASTKGNTLLQYFGLDNKYITKIADRNSTKWGLKTIGTEIPICSEEEMRKDNPDYLLILPWHFIKEFKQREKEYLEKGGHFIMPSPEFEII